MEEKIVIKTYQDVPILSISLQSTLSNKTGAWRYLRPSYITLRAPCSQACPLGQDISFYLTALADGKPEEAWKKILEANPFPSVCGRVCHHPCERIATAGNTTMPWRSTAWSGFWATGG